MKNMAIIAGALIDGISPIDILPDLLPPFTYIDDLGVLIAAVRYVLKSDG